MDAPRKRLRVLKPGARVVSQVPCGPGAFTFKSHHLAPGAVIEEVGHHYVGSLCVPTYRTAQGYIGEAEPNSWGSPSRAYFEPVQDEVQP